jgi:voltage-gated potassium channel
MKEKNHHGPIIHLYSYVGTPELVFFISLILILILPVFSVENFSLISTVFNSFFLGSLFYLAKSHNPKRLRLIGYFILIAFIDSWTSYFGIKLNNVFDYIIPLVLLVLSFFFVAKSLLRTSEVDIDTVISAISGYILIGLGFGILFYLIDVIRPGNFFAEEQLSYYEAKYLSFITISTLGYGDITPSSHAARSLVIIATLIGQFYMAIIMGIIVSKFISQKRSN